MNVVCVESYPPDHTHTHPPPGAGTHYRDNRLKTSQYVMEVRGIVPGKVSGCVCVLVACVCVCMHRSECRVNLSWHWAVDMN
jgi:hypothetical protein